MIEGQMSENDLFGLATLLYYHNCCNFAKY